MDVTEPQICNETIESKEGSLLLTPIQALNCNGMQTKRLSRVKRQLFNNFIRDEEDLEKVSEDIDDPYADSGSEFVPSPQSKSSDSDSNSSEIVKQAPKKKRNKIKDTIFQGMKLHQMRLKEETCQFCNFTFTNIRKHWMDKHAEERYNRFDFSNEALEPPSGKPSILSEVIEDSYVDSGSKVVHQPQAQRHGCQGGSHSEVILKEKPRQKSHKKEPKKHNCYFCNSLYTNIRKHWKNKHAKETLVQEALEASKGQGKYHRAFDKLRKMGDEEHNKLNGELIVVRKSTKTICSKYVTCVKCAGRFIDKNYARHRRLFCQDSRKEVSIVGSGRVLASNVSKEAHPLLISDILPSFQKEEHRSVLYNDPAAIIFGNMLCDEQLSKPDSADLYKYVANQLRLLADIFNIAHTIDPNIKEIDDIFHAHRYETLVEAIRVRGKRKNGIYGAPYPAMQCCIVLKKLCTRLKSVALSKNFSKELQRYDAFLTVLRDRQNTDVTKAASASRVSERRNKVTTLPSTEEVKSLFSILENETVKTFEAAKANITMQTYAALAKTIAARIMVMNRRRPGDVHKTTLEEFKNLTTPDKEYIDGFEGPDKQVASQFCRYVTKGKLNKTTSNLVTRDIVTAINFLIEHRNDVGIPEDNPYIFANPRAKRSPFYRADDALQMICKKNNISYKAMQATKLRKHLATTTINMDPQTQMTISKFMGHSFNIHQDIYQVREMQTDVGVMGKILFDASGQNQTNRTENKNKKIESIDEVAKPLRKDIDVKKFLQVNIERVNVEGISNDLPQEEAELGGEFSVMGNSEEKPCDMSDQLSDGDVEIADDKQEEDRTFIQNINLRKKKHKLPIEIRHYKDMNNRQQTTFSRTWRTPHKSLIRKLFHTHLSTETIPSVHEVQLIIAEYGKNINRNFTQIRTWIRNEINRRNRNQDEICKKSWTTPQKRVLRTRFRKYYEELSKTGKSSYPSGAELQAAIESEPLLAYKTSAILRSKLQNEFKNWNLIQRNSLN